MFRFSQNNSHSFFTEKAKIQFRIISYNSIFSGNLVFAQGAAATPVTLLHAMTEHGKTNKLKNIGVCHMHTEGHAPYTDPECEGIFR